MKDYRTIAASDLGKGSRIALELCETEVDLYWKMAMEVAELIESSGQQTAHQPEKLLVYQYG